MPEPILYRCLHVLRSRVLLPVCMHPASADFRGCMWFGDRQGHARMCGLVTGFILFTTLLQKVTITDVSFETDKDMHVYVVS